MPGAVIFDMDDVLIDSEPLWQQAETAVFAAVGISLTPAIMAATMGMRIDAVVAHRHAQFHGMAPHQRGCRTTCS